MEETNTERDMKKARLKALEEQLVAVAREITAHAQSPAFAIPYSHGDTIRYVIIGNAGACQGLVTNVRNRERMNKKVKKK